MVTYRSLGVPALFIATLVVGSIVLSFVISPAIQNELLYQQVVAVPDAERRQERLEGEADDKRVDMTAFAGMPEPYSEVVAKYIESVSSAIESNPIMRRRFYHRQRERAGVGPPMQYPDDANPIYDRDVVVPLVILPRPEAARAWSASAMARSLGWLAENKSSEKRGSVYGRTLIFKPGIISKIPGSHPASPFGTSIPSWHLYAMGLMDDFFLGLGKLVVTPHYDNPNSTLRDRSADLHLGEVDGGKLLGELITAPACLKNNRLRWVSIRKGTCDRRFLAYSLLDGNGAKRRQVGYQESKSGPMSPYVRPLICDRYQPRINQHDELLLPSPMAWPPTYVMNANIDRDAHEEWCLDDWFPAQKDACWVIREAEDSKPLQESFLLMPASEKSDRPVFLVALFAETKPQQLVIELAALHKVSPDAVLNSPETMERLNSLYQKVRDFPLAK